MDATQLYETTIYNRDDGQGFSFVTVPTRSLVIATLTEVEPLARALTENVTLIEPLEAWSLPFFLDGALGRWIGPEQFREWRFYFDIPNRRGPSPFAQYLAYAPVVPFESSPLSAKALAQLITGGGASGAVGYVTGHPLFILYTAAGIIICGAARGVGAAMEIGLRTALLRWMGIEEVREAELAGGIDEEDEDES